MSSKNQFVRKIWSCYGGSYMVIRMSCLFTI